MTKYCSIRMENIDNLLAQYNSIVKYRIIVNTSLSSRKISEISKSEPPWKRSHGSLDVRRSCDFHDGKAESPNRSKTRHTCLLGKFSSCVPSFARVTWRVQRAHVWFQLYYTNYVSHMSGKIEACLAISRFWLIHSTRYIQPMDGYDIETTPLFFPSINGFAKLC